MNTNWTRRGVLGAAASLGALAVPKFAPGASGSRRFILIIAEGGWDVTFSIDPKLGSPYSDGPIPDIDPTNPLDREEILTFGEHRIAVNPYKRPSVANLFRQYHDRLCVVNGMWVGTIAHVGARARVLTGTSDPNAPDVATVVGVAAGNESPLVAADLSGLGKVGAYGDRTAIFGLEGQMAGLVDPAERMRSPDDNPYRNQTHDPTDRDAVLAFLEARASGDPRGSLPRGDHLIAARSESVRRAQQLLDLRITRASLSNLSGQLLQAVDLLERGTCHAVTVRTSPTFDTHIEQSTQSNHWNSLCEDLGYLIYILENRGLWENTTVAVLSEFGRLPLRNPLGGTDHFPHTSAILLGGGIAGGRVIGGTDDRVLSQPIDFATGQVDPAGEYIRPENLLAGLLEVLDVDPGEWLPGVIPLRAFQA